MTQSFVVLGYFNFEIFEYTDVKKKKKKKKNPWELNTQFKNL
jgi:hypothetical protein